MDASPNALPAWVFVLWLLSAPTELYLFLMQRCALEVGRDNDLPGLSYQLMLPEWYPLTWLARIGKWASVILAWVYSGWGTALWMFFVPFVVGIVIPVPYAHYFPKFYKRLLLLALTPSGPEAAVVFSALARTDTKYGITKPPSAPTPSQ